MAKQPMSIPTILTCKTCKSNIVVVSAPGLMMPISQMDELKCPVCRENTLK